jgi:hypothetical protein
MANLCDPQSYAVGSVVRLRGVVTGTHYGGYGLIAEDCNVSYHRGYIRLSEVRTAAGGAALERPFEPANLRPGILHADLSGQIIGTNDHQTALQVQTVHGLTFQDMNEQQEKLYWRKRHGS